jgi:hypothetical protein
MNHLESLASLLAQQPDRVVQPAQPEQGDSSMSANMAPSADMDRVIATLRQQARVGAESHAPQELQMQAVQRFWQTQHLDTLKDARLVCFGMCLSYESDGPCVMEDDERLTSLLKGIDQWLDEPRWFRRCYQGLVRSYFAYDAYALEASSLGRQNWERLRLYLSNRLGRILDKVVNPDWVQATISAPHLFSDVPCNSYAPALLEGNCSAVDSLCTQLGIPPTSWFLRELVLAQIKSSIGLTTEAFLAVLPTLVERLRSYRVLRDAGLALLLNHYATLAQADMHAGLRDAAILWWGNPWIVANETRWSGATGPARAMVAEWLKLDLIEIYFTKFTDGAPMDRRRCDFWKRYIKSMENIRFTLSPQAPRLEEDASFKLEGITTHLTTQHEHSSSAFEMTIGPVVLVEFNSCTQDACGYDARKSPPITLGHLAAQPVLRMQHLDGVQGWRKWEDMFEATLLRQFDIRTGAARAAKRDQFVDLSDLAIPVSPHSPTAQQMHPQVQTRSPRGLGEDFHWQTAEAASVPFSRADLEIFARVHSLQLEDMTMQGGSLWVHAGDSDARISRVLTRWGFVLEAGKGWRRADRKTLAAREAVMCAQE